MTRNDIARRARRLVLAIGLAIMALALVFLLAGCSQTPPPEPIIVTAAPPDIPPECVVICPGEPKLPGDGAIDIADDIAAKDRFAMKTALRCERHARSTCAARLKVTHQP